jgi:hypothetical protein
MSDVRPIGTVDEEVFATSVPCKTEALLGSVVRCAIVDGVDDVERGCESEFIIEERAPDGVAVLDGAIDAERGVKKFFVFVSW